MKNKVKSVRYNWRQVGSTIDRDGAGEDWHSFTLGEHNITEIKEVEPNFTGEVWNYEIYVNGILKYRIFNPNFVEYE